MSVVERVERYTSREREKLDRGDAPLMRHLAEIGSVVALCGYQLPFGPHENLPPSENDCVVCDALYRTYRSYL